MNLFLVIIALLLIVCIDHEVRINRLENDNENDNEITEGQFGVPPMIWVFFGVCLLCLVLVVTGLAEKIRDKFIKWISVRDTKPTDLSKPGSQKVRW